MPGLFLSCDGLDGTGKSTQCRLLIDRLRAAGRTVVSCREPGGTPLGDRVRELLLDKQYDMSLPAESFLFMASRAELVRHVIRPALADDSVVVCDRFLLASVAYQGYGGGLSLDAIRAMGQLATGGLAPDLTLVFDLPVEAALARRGRAADRMEDRAQDYHERVRHGFLTEAAAAPDRIRIVDASGDADTIHRAAWAIVAPLVGLP
ncbi:MAG: dTMP kinase [Gemmataceae bacterium]|nr:dTMP kinase [Gemmataceae bacterium]